MGLRAELYAIGDADDRLEGFMDYGLPENGRAMVLVFSCATRGQSEELAAACGLSRPVQSTVCKPPKTDNLSWVDKNDVKVMNVLEAFG